MTTWIKGYEGLYEITAEGGVYRHYKSGTCKRLKPTQNRCGYPTVGLSKNSKVTTKLVHRLVAETFIHNPDNLPVVDHIDEDKTNYRADNLRWCTGKENYEFYCTKEGRRHHKKLGEKRKAKLKDYEKRLQEVRKELNIKEKELEKKEKELKSLKTKLESYELSIKDKEAVLASHITSGIGTSKEKYEDYMDTSGVKFTSVDELAEITGKPISVDGKDFRSCGAAAAYIVEVELGKGRSRNKATISKELRRYLKGLRPPWKMYNIYEVL